MQPKQSTSTTKKIFKGVMIVILVVVAAPIIILFVMLVSHGTQGSNDANYMKNEMTKITLPNGITQKSVDCHDVELRQECYFTYTTTLPKATVADSIKQSFTNAGYSAISSESSRYEDIYSVGAFQNNSVSLYASVLYRLDSELAPANQTPAHDSQLEIQMYKLQSNQ